MKYYIALFQKIKEYSKTLNANASEVTLICPSLRVYDQSELKLLLPQFLIEEELKGEALLKKEDMSFQLNSLPSSNQYWDVNPANTLFEAYKKIINTKQQTPENVDPTVVEDAQKVLYNGGKPTKQKKSYDKYLMLFDELLQEWETHLMKFNELQTDDEKNHWCEKSNMIQLKRDKLLVDHKLLGFKKEIENAFASINKRDELAEFLNNLNSLRNITDISTKTGLHSMDSYHDINFVPYDFMSGDNGWIQLSLDKKELDELYEIAKLEKNDFLEELLNFDYDEKVILGIELEFSIVTLQRNWFSLSAIVSRFFKWDEAITISDGQTISNDFLLSAYPKRMILIRNLKINLEQTVDPAVIGNLNQLIHFGPIIMKNQLFTDANKNTKFIKAIRNTKLLDSENIRYLRKKAAVQKIATATDPVIRSSTAPIRILPPTITRLQPDRLKRLHTFTVNPVLFQPVLVTAVPLKLATIVLSVKDSISKAAVYKSEISIIGVNNNFFREIESDQNGEISTELPIGNYTIKIQKDGYKIFESAIGISNGNTITKTYELLPESVTYDSFFLIGMICEILPKIPR